MKETTRNIHRHKRPAGNRQRPIVTVLLRIVGKYVGVFEGQSVFESDLLGTYSDYGGFSGFTLPDRGICVGTGVP